MLQSKSFFLWARCFVVEYREVTGFPAYRVGDDGTLWSKHKGPWRELVGGVDKDGYRRAVLCHDGTRKSLKVHTLVLNEFVGPRPSGREAAHNNGVRTDNRVLNLRWAAHEDNIRDKKAHGTHQAGEAHGCALLSEDQVLQIRALWQRGGKTQREIGSEFGVSNITVSAIVRRRLWKHI